MECTDSPQQTETDPSAELVFRPPTRGRHQIRTCKRCGAHYDGRAGGIANQFRVPAYPPCFSSAVLNCSSTAKHFYPGRFSTRSVICQGLQADTTSGAAGRAPRTRRVTSPRASVRELRAPSHPFPSQRWPGPAQWPTSDEGRPAKWPRERWGVNPAMP
jgi:hypothetical protein